MDKNNNGKTLGKSLWLGYYDDDPVPPKKLRKREIRQAEERQWRQEMEEDFEEDTCNGRWVCGFDCSCGLQ